MSGTRSPVLGPLTDRGFAVHKPERSYLRRKSLAEASRSVAGGGWPLDFHGGLEKRLDALAVIGRSRENGSRSILYSVRDTVADGLLAQKGRWLWSFGECGRLRDQRSVLQALSDTSTTTY